MPICKSPYMFVIIQKQYPGNFALLVLKFLELFAGESVSILKSRLIFNIFYCFWIFVCNKTFHISEVRISSNVKSVLIWNIYISHIRNTSSYSHMSSNNITLQVINNKKRFGVNLAWKLNFNELADDKVTKCNRTKGVMKKILDTWLGKVYWLSIHHVRDAI